MQSPKGQLILNDFISVLKNTVIFFGPQLLFFLSQEVGNYDFGGYGIKIAVVLSILVKLLDKKYTESIYK